MQFRCFSCGFKFSDGPPPLEALSGSQYNAIYGVKREASQFPMPEKFADLTPYNFCAFCLVLVVDFPSTFQDIDGHVHKWERSHYRDDIQFHVVFCECGELHQSQVNVLTYDPAFNWKANRQIKLHKARIIYPNGDFTLATEIIEKEI